MEKPWERGYDFTLHKAVETILAFDEFALAPQNGSDQGLPRTQLHFSHLHNADIGRAITALHYKLLTSFVSLGKLSSKRVGFKVFSVCQMICWQSSLSCKSGLHFEWD